MFRELEFHSVNADDYKNNAGGQEIGTHHLSYISNAKLQVNIEAAVEGLELEPGKYLVIQRTDMSSYVNGYSVLIDVVAPARPQVIIHDTKR